MSFDDTLKNAANEVNEYLNLKLHEIGNGTELDDAMRYAVMGFGKRIRPILLNNTYLMLSKNFNNDLDPCILRDFMIAVEFIHCYSLVHDDLPSMDNSDMRRGLPTVHKKYNEYIAVLTGDALLNSAMEIITKTMLNNLDLRIANSADILFSCAGNTGMIKGQVLDMNAINSKDIEELSQLTYYKTVKLIEASMLIGAVLAGADEDKISTIKSLAHSIGMLFQIQDDILDYDEDIENKRLSYATFYGLKDVNKIKLKYKKNAFKLLDEIDKNNFFFKEFTDFLCNRKR